MKPLETGPKAIVDRQEEMKLLHERYLVAVNNLSRRQMLEALRGGGLTIEEIGSKTNLNCEVLRWHLGLLESS